MKIAFLFLTIITSGVTCLSQSIYFPALGDGAQNPKAEFGYLENVPVEIEGVDIDTLFCDNGKIKMKSRKSYDQSIADYYIKPERIGPLTVTLVSDNNGKPDTISSSITIVNRPKLTLVVHRDRDIFKINLIDETNNIVTDNFYCSMEIDFISNRKLTGLITGKWKNGLSIEELIPKDIKDKYRIDRLVFNTTAVYSKEYGLYTGSYSCSMRMKN